MVISTCKDIEIIVNPWYKKWLGIPSMEVYTFIKSAQSQSRSRVHTPSWSLELAFPVPYRTRIWTGNRDQASFWRNQLCTRIILRANLRIYFATNVTLPSPLVRASSARYHWIQTRESLRGPNHVCYQHSGRKKEIHWHENQGFWRKNQVSD